MGLHDIIVTHFDPKISKKLLLYLDLFCRINSPFATVRRSQDRDESNSPPPLSTPLQLHRRQHIVRGQWAGQEEEQQWMGQQEAELRNNWELPTANTALDYNG
jgi:hypothetical protein